MSDAGNTEYLEKLSAEGRKWGGHLAVEASREMHAWLDHPTVMVHYASRGLIDGSSWKHWVSRQLGGPAERSMELGCGSASLSLELHALGATREVEGFDASPERIAEAETRRTASRVPGRFWAGDANTLELEPGRYDLIVSSHSYHHFLELERINAQVLRALTPRGLFILEEFVGPTQFQWTDAQIEVTKALMALIPERYRMLRWGAVKPYEGRPTVEDVVAASPFESIRSAEIVPLFERGFRIVHRRNLGGTIQHLLHNGIIHNFVPGDPEAERILRSVIEVEDALVDSDLLPSDFQLLIGQREGPEDAKPARAPAASVAAPAAPPRATEAFDRLVQLLGFDPERPGWFPALRELHRYSRSQRLQLTPDTHYTSAFSPADLPEAVWEGTFPDCGRFDLEAQRAFLRETPSFAESLSSLPNELPEDEATYHWGNPQFSHSDASLYYSLIRRFRPQRIVEVGAGHSTKLAAKAISDNGCGRIVCIDPNAPPWLAALGAAVEVLVRPVQESPDSVFLDLGPSDILFIDGSHISKTGSDVNHLFLRVLPKLPKGVLVQVHDICLPFEYQRAWSEEYLSYWNEQYVLAALLANSRKYEVLLGVYFLQRTCPEDLNPFVPAVPGVFAGGGSLWLQSRE